MKIQFVALLIAFCWTANTRAECISISYNSQLPFGPLGGLLYVFQSEKEVEIDLRNVYQPTGLYSIKGSTGRSYGLYPTSKPYESYSKLRVPANQMVVVAGPLPSSDCFVSLKTDETKLLLTHKVYNLQCNVPYTAIAKGLIKNREFSEKHDKKEGEMGRGREANK